MSSYLSNPSNILLPILGREAQVLVQPEPHIIAVQPISRQAEFEQVLLERSRDGGFARGREAGEPDGAAFLLAQLAALGAREAGVPGDVAVWEEFVRGIGTCGGKHGRSLTYVAIFAVNMDYGVVLCRYGLVEKIERKKCIAGQQDKSTPPNVGVGPENPGSCIRQASGPAAADAAVFVGGIRTVRYNEVGSSSLLSIMK